VITYRGILTAARSSIGHTGSRRAHGETGDAGRACRVRCRGCWRYGAATVGGCADPAGDLVDAYGPSWHDSLERVYDRAVEPPVIDPANTPLAPRALSMSWSPSSGGQPVPSRRLGAAKMRCRTSRLGPRQGVGAWHGGHLASPSSFSPEPQTGSPPTVERSAEAPLQRGRAREQAGRPLTVSHWRHARRGGHHA